MALQSVQQHGKRSGAKLRTQAAKFRAAPAYDDGLLEVRSGEPAEHALTEAVCLADAIKSLAQGGVDHGIGEETSYLIVFVADTIGALVESVRNSIERAEIEAEDAA